jgi:hypothetical protein
VFFTNAINQLEAYFKYFAIDWKALLEDKPKQRVLAEKPAKERILNSFTPDDFYRLTDPYQDKNEDPEFNKSNINNMFDFQKGYEDDRNQGYIDFSKNQYHYLDAGMNFDEGIPETLFRTSSSEVIDLDKFETRVKVRGASFGKHIETCNINEPIKELIVHLKSKVKFKIFYEKLDPTLLDMINDVSNFDVKRFHRDNFINYYDFSAELKRNEIFSKIG